MSCSFRWRNSSDFKVITDSNKSYFTSNNLGLQMRLKPGGYVPRSGLYLLETLDYSAIYGSVLDVGTGETGLLAHYLLISGARHVVACDIDFETILHASKSSTFSGRIQWLNGDVFDGISGIKFDLIVSNPPQMPCIEGCLHDCGGLDGRIVINRIIQEAQDYLEQNGHLLLLCFDFLGVDRCFNRNPSLCELAEKNGLSGRIICSFTRMIRRGGKTEANLSWINAIYPGYRFQKTPDGRLFHNVYILELSKS